MSCGTWVLVNKALPLSDRELFRVSVFITSNISNTSYSTKDRMMKTIKSSIKPKSTYENIRPR